MIEGTAAVDMKQQQTVAVLFLVCQCLMEPGVGLRHEPLDERGG